ncbi:unnamed protein product [Bursaphelenchus xylophilus]|uniref:(pine wood nematode) hypothetical protein n=1 Tax=Bursaphelenchus xylophilus TaxID=6326 RepID=A0A1I7S836_BURXY|nr:unnamed protein product [Bursaphelenchus xylophilus]CAG9080628.1 unnamed protein product [Bursaphelenchus xylophilus]
MTHCAGKSGCERQTKSLSHSVVDASELIGICSVGNLNPYTLMSFVLIPRLVLVFFGSCFIIAGFSSMCGERKSFKRRGTDTSKLDTLLFKMGSFSTLYIVPTLILCLCDAYHVFVLTRWYPTTVDCKRNGGASHCPRAEQPHAEVYMLALAMSLASGLATGLWILSSKTLKSWRRVLCCGHLEDDPSLDKPLLIPTQTYVANNQPQQHPLITQVIPNANGVNHYIPLSVMTNGQSSNLGSSRQGYHINEHWKNLNGL